MPLKICSQGRSHVTFFLTTRKKNLYKLVYEEIPINFKWLRKPELTQEKVNSVLLHDTYLNNLPLHGNSFTDTQDFLMHFEASLKNKNIGKKTIIRSTIQTGNYCPKTSEETLKFLTVIKMYYRLNPRFDDAHSEKPQRFVIHKWSTLSTVLHNWRIREHIWRELHSCTCNITS